MGILAFIIEHLEPVVSRWVWYEYKHTSKIVGKDKLIITNVKDPRERAKLLEIASKVYEESIINLPFDKRKLIILDPQANRALTPNDFNNDVYVVIGGIMGDYPPKGRTKILLSDKIPEAIKRNIGKEQFSVDGAAYVALQIAKGKTLEQIPFITNLEIKVNEIDGMIHTIVLPYSYPLVNNRPLISQELVNYLKNDIEKDEMEFIRIGRVKSIVEYIEE